MAIGTTLKVGFDGTAVKKGFGSIGGMFKSAGKGMAMGAGAMMSKSLVDLAIKAATGVDALADFVGAAEDVALQTGTTAAEIIKLDKALEIAGSTIDSGRALSTMRDNIYDAANGGEELQKAFRDIGLQSKDLAGKSTMEQFRMIGESIAAMGDNAGEAENALEKIFGAKMSMQLLRLFRNGDIFDQVEEEFGEAAENMMESGERLGKVQDQFRRIPFLWKSLNLAIFDKLGGGAESIKKIMDGIQEALNTGDFSKLWENIKELFSKAMKLIQDSEVWKWIAEKIRELGKIIGEGVRDAFNPLSGVKVPSIFGAGSDTASIDPTKEIMKTNSILERIYREGGAVYG